MSEVEHYFENLIHYGKDISGNENKDFLSKEVQEAVEECALYIRSLLGLGILAYTDVKPAWIPVSERLPEANGRYLVTRGLNACGALWNRIYIVNYSDLMGLKPTKIWWNGNVGKSDFETYNDILAWMPLPQPYNAESEDK